jgi:lysozyme family protein
MTIYDKLSFVNIAIKKIKNFLSRNLLIPLLFFRVAGVSHNTSNCKNLFPADSNSSQNKIFYHALSWHLKHEGLIANHPSDPGGFTYAGIARNVHDNWEGWKYLNKGKPIPESMIVSFYDSLVWKPMMCDSVPPAIAFYLFDTACLIGTPYTIYLLQKNLNIKPDGLVGPQTLQAIRNHNPKDLLSKLHASRIAFHNKMVQKYPNLNVFYKGWIRRANLTYLQSIKLINTNQIS